MLILPRIEAAQLETLATEGNDAAQLVSLVSQDGSLKTPLGTVNVGTSSAELVALNVTLPYVKNHSRGRRILVIDMWGGGGESSIARSEELEALIPLSYQTDSAYEEVRQILEEKLSKDCRVWAAYTLAIDNAIPVNSEIHGLREATRFDKLHSRSVEFDRRALRFSGQEKLESYWYSKCGSCHETQYDAWKSSRHSTAFTTLLVGNQSGNRRCTPCHTTPDLEKPQRFAVGCQSCHTGDRNSVSPATCRGCHTDVTDPLARYAKGYGHVCSTTPPTGKGVCGRK